MIPGMGHDLPEALWTTIIDAAVANAAKASSTTSSDGDSSVERSGADVEVG